MAFEETLVCDGCSRVIDGGSRETTLGGLRKDGGRAFDRDRRGKWRELDAGDPWCSSRRHLGGCCANADVFYDLEPVPRRTEVTR
jgi:hypothetical protein